jgi:hypothetical protein
LREIEELPVKRTIEFVVSVLTSKRRPTFIENARQQHERT